MKTDMTYELAKELKEAGYPQKGKGEWFNNSTHETTLNEFSDNIYAPTLEELIDACGNEIVIEISKDNQTTAYEYEHSNEDGTPYRYYGKNAVEAMANLWLGKKKWEMDQVGWGNSLV